MSTFWSAQKLMHTHSILSVFTHQYGVPTKELAGEAMEAEPKSASLTCPGSVSRMLPAFTSLRERKVRRNVCQSRGVREGYFDYRYFFIKKTKTKHKHRQNTTTIYCR